MTNSEARKRQQAASNSEPGSHATQAADWATGTTPDALGPQIAAEPTTDTDLRAELDTLVATKDASGERTIHVDTIRHALTRHPAPDEATIPWDRADEIREGAIREIVEAMSTDADPAPSPSDRALTEDEWSDIACRCHVGICPIHNEDSDCTIEFNATDLYTKVDNLLSARLAAVEADRDRALEASACNHDAKVRWFHRAEKAEAEVTSLRDQVAAVDHVVDEWASGCGAFGVQLICANLIRAALTDPGETLRARDERVRAERAGTERVEWGVRVKPGVIGEVAIDAETAEHYRQHGVDLHVRTVTEFAPVVSPWVAVEAGDDDE